MDPHSFWHQDIGRECEFIPSSGSEIIRFAGNPSIDANCSQFEQINTNFPQLTPILATQDIYDDSGLSLSSSITTPQCKTLYVGETLFIIQKKSNISNSHDNSGLFPIVKNQSANNSIRLFLDSTNYGSKLVLLHNPLSPVDNETLIKYNKDIKVKTVRDRVYEKRIQVMYTKIRNALPIDDSSSFCSKMRVIHRLINYIQTLKSTLQNIIGVETIVEVMKKINLSLEVNSEGNNDDSRENIQDSPLSIGYREMKRVLSPSTSWETCALINRTLKQIHLNHKNRTYNNFMSQDGIRKRYAKRGASKGLESSSVVKHHRTKKQLDTLLGFSNNDGAYYQDTWLNDEVPSQEFPGTYYK